MNALLNGVIVLNVKHSILNIDDGLQYSLETWSSHVLALLKCCQLVPINHIAAFVWTTALKSMVLVDLLGVGYSYPVFSSTGKSITMTHKAAFVWTTALRTMVFVDFAGG